MLLRIVKTADKGTARRTKANAPSPNSRENLFGCTTKAEPTAPMWPTWVHWLPRSVGCAQRRRRPRCFETSGTRDGNTDPPNGPNHDPRVYFSPCSGHLHMPNIATASTHRAGSARPAGHAWPECCCCEIAMLGNVFSYVSAYKSTEKKCYEKNRKASEKPR